jgi:hypothetical protein
MGMINKKRIIELADFFYSSDSSEDVPLRLCCETGRFTGFDLNRDEFISLFSILVSGIGKGTKTGIGGSFVNQGRA